MRAIAVKLSRLRALVGVANRRADRNHSNAMANRTFAQGPSLRRPPGPIRRLETGQGFRGQICRSNSEAGCADADRPVKVESV